ncbi:unnamed protein product [Linum trigynum]|uniref:RNase H type-1 domain-containing protein n=1 Tax=Linum trigynum TaxID=586398 RepID=A0AAV2GP62_9ROSI
MNFFLKQKTPCQALGDREILLTDGVQFPLIDDPMEVELMVLREAILLCLGHGFMEVRFKGDAKVVIKKIIRAHTKDSRIGVILEEIVQYFALHTRFSVRFVGQSSNMVAHLVARKALALYPTASRIFDFQALLKSRM